MADPEEYLATAAWRSRLVVNRSALRDFGEQMLVAVSCHGMDVFREQSDGLIYSPPHIYLYNWL